MELKKGFRGVKLGEISLFMDIMDKSWPLDENNSPRGKL